MLIKIPVNWPYESHQYFRLQRNDRFWSTGGTMTDDKQKIVGKEVERVLADNGIKATVSTEIQFYIIIVPDTEDDRNMILLHFGNYSE